MENKEIELTDEELLFIKSLESKLNVTEYSELRKIVEKYIRLARNKDYEAEYANNRYKSLSERNEDYYNKIQEEKEQKEKWKNYYKEVCNKYAKLEVEVDLAKAKIEILEGENNNGNV